MDQKKLGMVLGKISQLEKRIKVLEEVNKPRELTPEEAERLVQIATDLRIRYPDGLNTKEDPFKDMPKPVMPCI